MGLAILAGAIGLAFSNLDKISRFKGAGFEAEMKMVHTIIENQTEPSPEQKKQAIQSDGLSDEEARILVSLQKPGYTWRYARTVSGEVSLPLDKTESILFSLMTRGFAKNGTGSDGEIWAITNVGKSVQEQYRAKAAKGVGGISF
ncbi:hypothetical protein FV139_13255 [Parahaliea maris]|uniref:Uncharacterized protein n=1 Tax=Parahaliea maris TaxID=2716870 RepID=A0A5C8ZZ75_9GAMM|nr:hypothetical protein [Parahaliea maris]TXS92922.1 hypothetical protein FV139_13255 [Parahaliea maris]